METLQKEARILGCDGLGGRASAIAIGNRTTSLGR